MKNWKVVLLLVALAALMLPFGSRAQEAPTFGSVEVDLWPEFDRPSMLVIYHITLSPEIELPADLSLRIPAEAGSPHAVAMRQPNGDLFSAAYERQVMGDWAEIIFTATSPDVQLEYYDPTLEMDGSQRHFEYNWPGDYAVGDMNIVVQQPVGATNLQLAPGLGSSRTGSDGLVYHTVQVGPLSEGQDFTITLDYEKESDSLSAASLQVEPSAPISGSQTGLSSLSSALPWILGVLGLALIVGGGVWYYRSGQERGAKTQRRGRRKSNPRTEAASEERSAGGYPEMEGGAGSSHIYCHQCGKRAAPGDKFCRTCGTRLRSE